MKRLFILCCLWLATSTHVDAATELVPCKIVKVHYIDDDFDPEVVVVLDNDVRILTKWTFGILYPGQEVGLLVVDEDTSKLEFITYHADGSESGSETCYRKQDTPLLYYAF